MDKKNWIQDAIKKPGGLHKMLGIKSSKNIPNVKIEKATKSSNPLERKRAILAQTLAKFKK